MWLPVVQLLFHDDRLHNLWVILVLLVVIIGVYCVWYCVFDMHLLLYAGTFLAVTLTDRFKVNFVDRAFWVSSTFHLYLIY